MRVLGFIAVMAILPACQMGLPTGKTNLENEAPQAVDASPEANLAAAFEQAALAAEIAPEPKRKALFGFLKPDEPATPAVLAGTDIEVVDGALPVEAIPETALLTDAPELPVVENTDPILDTIVPVKSGLGGLFGFLKPKQTSVTTQAALKAPSPEIDPAVSGNVDIGPVPTPLAENTPALLEEPTSEANIAPKKPIFGFLKPKAGARNTSLSTVALGETLPFGTVGISCDARPKDMGKRVDQFPNTGTATWQIYDTNPTSTTPRTQYITGFKDGCARQVTAALILFGAPSLHEVHRYAKARSKVSWSKADNTYETIKSKVCGVGRATPCPENKIGKLEKHMAFVSVYKQFGDAQGWLELLLYDGKVTTKELR
jgi:hypothetical protein